MAVAAMKHVTISGLIEELDAVVHACIINREFHPENAVAAMDQFKGFFPFEQDNPYTSPLRRISDLSDQAGITLDYRDFEGMGLSLESVVAYLESFKEELERMTLRREELARLKAQDLQILNQLSHISGINANLDEFFDLEYVQFRFGRMPKEAAHSLIMYIDGRSDVYYYQTGADGGYIYGMYIMPRAMAEQIDAIFLSLHFERIFISGRVHGTSEEAIETIRGEIRGAEAETEELHKGIEAFRSDQ
ncbi:MAG: hypothetical protein LBH09_08360, partial [Peptococcaceae bacterium]|nr:hypothetical protein [Peptococcaceae bacterium]